MLEFLVKGTNMKPNTVPEVVKTLGHTSHHGGPKTYLRVPKAVRSHRIAALASIGTTLFVLGSAIPNMMTNSNKYD
eukprot:CAMPEP_0114512404 /NCGR_PEP_ID=MMETSP0109-20121206/14958_1 /TAXON_ID=29199 /ORGANISM="Chlorarachnion reptans, Strain CCCM449" /LENGTH=75 /DNA_ID=CAMNT_0001692087 /DNA_START=40 /DNA_END=267 /DNA_ORIENTATION=+